MRRVLTRSITAAGLLLMNPSLGLGQRVDDERKARGDETLSGPLEITARQLLNTGKADFKTKVTPLLLAGRGGGTIKTGRMLKFKEHTSLSKLHISMLNRLGVNVERFGGCDSPMTEVDAG